MSIYQLEYDSYTLLEWGQYKFLLKKIHIYWATSTAAMDTPSYQTRLQWRPLSVYANAHSKLLTKTISSSWDRLFAVYFEVTSSFSKLGVLCCCSHWGVPVVALALTVVVTCTSPPLETGRVAVIWGWVFVRSLCLQLCSCFLTILIWSALVSKCSTRCSSCRSSSAVAWGWEGSVCSCSCLASSWCWLQW